MFRLNRWYWAGLSSLLIALFLFTASLHHDRPFAIGSSLYSHKTPASTTPSYKGSPKTSKFHLLAPASGNHFRLCRAIASSFVLGYPVPVFNGWMKEGDLDASKTHLAKVRTVMQYLESLPASADDDLVLMIDGYDVVFQIPPDVLIERYFAIIKAANAKIAARFGVNSIDELVGDEAPRQTILFGPEKACYPGPLSRVGCWAIPEDIDIPKGTYGPDDGALHHNLPRWLNSGTIIGPARDMRRMFGATLLRIKEKYDASQEFSDSDQKYMSDVWGEQEYWRSVKAHEQHSHGGTYPDDILPHDDIEDKVLPVHDKFKETEFHIGIDHRAALFQTRAGSDPVLDLLQYKETEGNQGMKAARVETNASESPNFKPYLIDLPDNLALSITRVLAAISRRVPDVTQLRLGTNIVTKNVYGLFHSTGGKDYIDDLWAKLWYYPYLKPLFEVAVKGLKEGKEIGVIEGRRWIPAHTLPKITNATNDFRDAGAWADLDSVWLEWNQLCGEFKENVFGIDLGLD